MTVIERRECKGCGYIGRALDADSHPKRDSPNQRCHGPAVTVEYVPAEQLQGAVEITDERVRRAAKRLRLEYGWKTGDPDHVYETIARSMLTDAFGGQ